METISHPSPRDLLPAELSALIQATGATTATTTTTTTTTTIPTLVSQLSRISRSTWLHLGADCHNKSFALDLAATQAAAPAPKGFMASLRAKEVRVTLDSGLPQIIQTIQRQSSEKEEEEEDTQKERIPSLWALYNFCKAVFAQPLTSPSSSSGSLAPSSSSRKEPVSRAWQLHFIKTGCPEVVVAAVLDLFLQQGLREGFDWAISQELVEAVDHELRSSHPTAKKAVQALIQTMISSGRFVKTSSSHHQQQQQQQQGKSKGLDMESEPTSSTPGQSNSEERATRREQECFQLASSLSDAHLALEAYLETETGKTLPKLVALFNQEVAADTKARSRASGERGTKRPGGLGGIGGGGGGGGSGVTSGQDDLAKKKQKLSNEVSGGSPSSAIGSTLASVQNTGATSFSSAESRKSVLVEASGMSQEQIAVLAHSSFKATTHYLEQAQLGYNTPTAGLGASASVQSSLNMSTLQQAKVNNPLWSAALGLNYSPQQQAKYGALVVNEIERWMSLLGHMDGAVFSERLVGLIKAVYPSDQKFLLDQILIEAMSLESKDSTAHINMQGAQDHLEEVDPKTVLLASLAAPFGSHTEVQESATKGQLAQTKTREWLIEMIMSALIGLVIKPEDSAAWIEPGATKWAEPVELSTIISEDVVTTNGPNEPDASSTTVGGASSSSSSSAAAAAAAGKNKKRRLRSLYNRRVSPFYATLAIFQQKKISARMSGMYYLTPEDLVILSKDTSDALLEQRKQQELLLQQQQELLQQAKMMRRHKDIDLDDPNLANLKGSRNNKRSRFRKSQKRKEERSGRQGSQGGQGGQGGGSGGGPGKPMDGGVHREGSMTEALSKLKDDSVRAKTESVMSAETETTTGGHEGDASSSQMVPDTESELIDGGDTEMLSSHAQHDEDREHGHHEENAEKSKEQDDLSDHDGWMGGFSDDQALTLAKEAGAGRQTCNAPFRVLMLVLRHLTRMNQAGALDAWISDAVSGTVPALQVRYFEWLLSHLVPIGAVLPKPEGVETTEGAQHQRYHQRQIRVMTAIQEEVWRLVKVLVAAPGIGHDPAKTALAHVTARVPFDNKGAKIEGEGEIEPGVMMETDVGGEGGHIWNEVKQLLLAETTDAPSTSTTGPSI